MLIYVVDKYGNKWQSENKTPNMIHDVPEGRVLTRLHVDGKEESMNMAATGETILVPLSVIRRIRDQKEAA